MEEITMIDILQVNPGLWVILAGIICAFLPVGQIRKALLLLAPIFAGMMIFQIYGAQEVIGGVITFAGMDYTTRRIDRL